MRVRRGAEPRAMAGESVTRPGRTSRSSARRRRLVRRALRPARPPDSNTTSAARTRAAARSPHFASRSGRTSVRRSDACPIASRRSIGAARGHEDEISLDVQRHNFGNRNDIPPLSRGELSTRIACWRQLTTSRSVRRDPGQDAGDGRDDRFDDSVSKRPAGYGFGRGSGCVRIRRCLRLRSSLGSA